MSGPSLPSRKYPKGGQQQPRAHAHEASDPGLPDEDATERLYRECQGALFAYLGGVETRAQAAEFQRALAAHRGAGRDPTVEHVAAACVEAAAYCDEHDRKHSIGPLIAALNMVLAPEVGRRAPRGSAAEFADKHAALMAAWRAEYGQPDDERTE